MAIDYNALDIEESTDPLGRGYSGMTSAQVADDMHLEVQGETLPTVNGDLVYEAVDRTEFGALGAGQVDRWRDQLVPIVNGGIAVDSQGNVRDWIQEIFGPGSVTLANYDSAIGVLISRARQLQLGNVKEHDIDVVRAT